jgi:hypothetical protein
MRRVRRQRHTQESSITSVIAQKRSQLLVHGSDSNEVGIRFSSPGRSPITAPVLSGQLGVLSPTRYVRKLTPLLPARHPPGGLIRNPPLVVCELTSSMAGARFQDTACLINYRKGNRRSNKTTRIRSPGRSPITAPVLSGQLGVLSPTR